MSGDSQGSVLGSILFNAYLVLTVPYFGNIAAYADDADICVRTMVNKFLFIKINEILPAI